MKFTKKLNFKSLSVLTVFIVMIALFATFIRIPEIIARADVASKPEFTVSIDSYEPKNVKIDEDITIHGTITPKPFEIAVPAKEIVLVLDVSGSMAGTKIANLKTAANNFIDKMNAVPNLKIGIVTYSTNATINQSLTDATNVTSLKKTISSLKADGGTNTGEGLRKAAYLLNTSKNKDDNKTIVFMSDGEPTYYSEKYIKKIWFPLDVDQGFYTSINEETLSEYGVNIKVEGPGNSDDRQGNCLNYAKTIGGIIKEKGYNVFSIGYGLGNSSSSGNIKMNSIHTSMSDNTSNLYVSDTGAIDNIFNTIADKILNTYTITNVNFNVGNNSLIEVIGGQTIRLSNLEYKKVSESNGRIRYEGEQIQFTLIIKAKIAGNDIPIFENSNVTFPWINNETITMAVPIVKINVLDNALPNIEATLVKDQMESYKLGQEISVTYNIKPQDFRYGNMSSQLIPKDVVLVLDNSSNMKDLMNDGGGPMINSLWNSMIDNNLFSNKNVKFGIVTFNSTSKIESYLTDNKVYLNDNIVKKIQPPNNDYNKNIGQSMENINSVLNGEGSRSDAKKYVVFLAKYDTNNKLNYSSTDINKLKDKGYNIVSMTLFSNNNSYLKDLHKNLIDMGNLGDLNDKCINSIDQNTLQNNDMNTLASKLADDEYKSYDFKNVKLKFDLNGNFDGISGFDEDSGDIRTISVPNVQYTINDGVWHAENKTVSFVIKPKKTGLLNFKLNDDITNISNSIIYMGIEKEINKTIETPEINVIPETELIHGLYKGIKIENGKSEANIESSNDKTFAKGASIPMAASFEINASGIIMTLNIDDRLTLNGEPKVYKILDDGKLQEIGELNSSDKYSYTFNSTGKIVIIYNVKIPIKDDDNHPYMNNIRLDTQENAAYINAEGDLRDLF